MVAVAVPVPSEPPPTTTAPPAPVLPLLLFPDEATGLVSVVDLLRERHADAAVANDAEVARRKATGIPLDDDTNWKSVADLVEKQKGGDVRDLARTILAHVSEPLAPSVPFDEAGHAHLAPIRVALRTMPAAEIMRLRARLNAAQRSYRAAVDADDEIGKADADVIYRDALGAFVAASVVVVDGIKGRSGKEVDKIDTRVAAALDRVGLLVPLFNACDHFQGLSAGKAARFGLLPQST